MKFTPPPRNSRISSALKGLLLSALLAFGAAHTAAAKTMVFLTTEESDATKPDFIERPRDEFAEVAKVKGLDFVDMTGALAKGNAAWNEEKIKAADIVVIVTVYEPVDHDRFKFLEGLMKETSVLQPQTFIIASDGCTSCHNDDNYNEFARVLREMAGWQEPVGSTEYATEGTTYLNTASRYAEDFTSVLPELNFGYFRYMRNIPSDLVLYPVPSTDPASNITIPAPNPGTENAFGLFLPMAEQAGNGACTFLVGDASIFQKRYGENQAAAFASAFVSAAAVNDDDDDDEPCACRKNWDPVCTNGYEAQNNQCVCVSGMFDADGNCLPQLPVCAEGEHLQGDVCVPDPTCAPGQLREQKSCATEVASHSSAPAMGWPALLGLGALLPLAARRRRK